MLGVLFIVPSCFIAGEVFVQWPAFAGVGAEGSGYLLSYAGALVSIAIGVCVLRALAGIAAPAGQAAIAAAEASR